MQVTTKSFAFPGKHGLPFHFVSAADGTNVVRVFEDAVRAAWAYKNGAKDFVAEVLELLNEDTLGSLPASVGVANGGAAGGSSASAASAGSGEKETNEAGHGGAAGRGVAGSGGAGAMPRTGVAATSGASGLVDRRG